MDESAFVFGKEYIDGDAADYKGLPLRVVNFYLDDGADDMESALLGIENFYLT